MPKKQAAVQPKPPKPQPQFVTVTRGFKHNGRRIVPGTQLPAGDPLVACFPDFFTPPPVPVGDGED